MKKVMFAAAALAAGVAMADGITSANVVGYANTGLRSGSKMIGASFNTVGDEGMDLSELKVDGYKDVDYFVNGEGCWGDFVIKVLNKNGGTALDASDNEMSYAFYQWMEDGEWIDADMGWYQGDADSPVAKGEVVFDPGQGLWFQVAGEAYPAGVASDKYKLTNAGEALMDASTVDLRSGSKGIVAPLSAAVDLSKITVTGYQDVDYFLDGEGCWGDFVIKVLNKNGGTALDASENEMSYAFYQWMEDGEWIDTDMGWYQGDAESPVAENEVVFAMGEGLWVQVAGEAYPSGVAADKYKLEFPGIDD